MQRAPRYDLLLSFRAFAGSADLVRRRVAALEGQLAATALLGADGYYRSADQRVILVCHFDARFMTGQILRAAHTAADSAGGGVIDLAELSDEQRRRLCDRILPTFDISHRELPTLDDAVMILAEAAGVRVEDGRRGQGTPPAVRFLRGEDWQAGRLLRIAEDGAVIASTGAPRVGDKTEIEIVAPAGTAKLEAITTQVTLPNWAQSLGTSGFSARFVQDERMRQPMTLKILAWARSAAHRASRPHRRRETRFPLCWPAQLELGSRHRAVKLRDVSQHGLFVETHERPRGQRVCLRVPCDQRDVPLRLSGRIVRAVDDSMAKTLGLPVGFGIALDPVAPEDAERFLAFVNRVASRTDRRVVIGATGSRLCSLVDHFAAAGYLTIGASDPRTLYQRATESKTPPELVLFDSSFGTLHRGGTAALKRRLDRSKTPFLDVDASPTDARMLVDAALLG